jgi:hypothetical protein
MAADRANDSTLMEETVLRILRAVTTKTEMEANETICKAMSFCMKINFHHNNGN